MTITVTKELDDKKLYSIKETAEFLGVTLGEVRRMILDGKIKATVAGAVFRFPGAEIRMAKTGMCGRLAQ